jgi:hypothetical protein
VAQLLQLVEAGQLDLEVPCRPALAARQRHQQPSCVPRLPTGLGLAPDEGHRLLAVDWQDVIGNRARYTGSLLQAYAKI